MFDPKFEPLFDRMNQFCTDKSLQTYEKYLEIKSDPLYKEFCKLGSKAAVHPVFMRFTKKTIDVMKPAVIEKLTDVVNSLKDRD